MIRNPRIPKTKNNWDGGGGGGGGGRRQCVGVEGGCSSGGGGGVEIQILWNGRRKQKELFNFLSVLFQKPK